MLFFSYCIKNEKSLFICQLILLLFYLVFVMFVYYPCSLLPFVTHIWYVHIAFGYTIVLCYCDTLGWINYVSKYYCVVHEWNVTGHLFVCSKHNSRHFVIMPHFLTKRVLLIRNISTLKGRIKKHRGQGNDHIRACRGDLKFDEEIQLDFFSSKAFKYPE